LELGLIVEAQPNSSQGLKKGYKLRRRKMGGKAKKKKKSPRHEKGLRIEEN